MTDQNDATEIRDLQDALLCLRLSEVGNPSHEQIDAAVARRCEGPDTEDQIHWDRIPWGVSDRLPNPGLQITSSTMHPYGRWMFRTDVVVRARPDPEPGWVRVKLRPLK
jgi:hypothetical protein